MKRPAFQRWMGRIGLAAAMLLLTVPTAGRLLQASAAPGHGHVAHHERIAVPGDSPAASAATGDDRAHRPGTGSLAPDCDYCPLLASLVSAARLSFAPPMAPGDAAASALPAVPRLAWLHPSGLGSRGPPASG